LIGREDEGLQLIEVNLLWNDSPLLAAQHAGSGELASGGICIAVSGGDGAGKSTAIEMLSSWLSPTFVLQQLHFGRPKPLLVSYVLYRSLGVLRRLGIDIPQPMSISEGGGSSFGFWSRLALCLQLLCVARDRRRTHERSRREVGMGGIVLCDRYPDSRISDMEGPRLANLWPSPGRWQARLLKFERECYQGFVRPDVHIILRVSPDVARQRQPEDDPELPKMST
jgi:thymidylate kinase